MELPIHWRSERDYSITVTISLDGQRLTLRAEKRGTFLEEFFHVDGHGLGRPAARLRNLADWLDANHHD